MEILLGITAADWIQLLKENQFSINRRSWSKAIFLTLKSLYNSKEKKKEKKLFKDEIENVTIDQSPLFIIGHWRSGTTLLHNYMTVDKQFAYPNLFEVYNPHTFLHLEPIIAPKLEKADSRKRPMDNVAVSYKSPGEDEFALNILSLKSPLLSWCFPRREGYYDRYLTFRDVYDEEKKEWQDAFRLFLKKLTLFYKKQIILKSPTHTCRIKMILEMFPDAKFIHIYRNPYNVFRSNQKLYDTVIQKMHVQSTNGYDPSESILKRYKLMYDQYFQEKELLQRNQLIELAFEDFEKEPLEKIKQIYEQFDLGDFELCEKDMKSYHEKLSGYKKNKYEPIPDSLKDKIVAQWGKSFREWGYKT